MSKKRKRKISNIRKTARINTEPAEKVKRNIFIRVIFIVFSMCYLLFAYNNCVSNYTGGGDSPYYLVAIKSLVEDGDIFISKQESEYLNYAEDYPFMLDKNMRLFDQEKHRYIHHPHGIVFAAVPFYYIGKKIDSIYGRLGVLLGLSFINIIAAIIFYKIARFFLTSQWISLTITLLLFLSPPVMGISSLIYPGSPYYLAYFGIIFLLVAKPLSNIKLNTFIIALLGGFIVLLHMRFAPVVACAYFLLFIFRKKKKFPQVHWITLATTCIALLSAYMMFSSSLTGASFIDALFKTSGNNSASSFSALKFLQQGMFGYLVDQQMGVLITIPVLCLSFVGLYEFYRDKKYHFLLLFIPAFVSYVFVGSFHNWAGQWGIISRFMIPSLPVLFLGLGYTIKLIVKNNSLFSKLVFCVLTVSHLVLSVATFIYPSLLLPMNPTSSGIITNQNPYFVALYNKVNLNLIDYFPEFVYTVEYDDFILAICFVVLVVIINLLLLPSFQRRKALVLIIAILPACIIFYASGVDAQKYKSPVESDRRWLLTPMDRLFNYDRIYIKWGARLLDSQPEKAEKFLKKALWVNTDSIEANYLYLLLNTKQNKLSAAVKYLSKTCLALKYSKVSGDILQNTKQIRGYLYNQINHKINIIKSKPDYNASDPELKNYENMLRRINLATLKVS